LNKGFISLFFSLGVFVAITFTNFTPANADTYTVVPGDSLFTISVNHGTTVHKLMELNQLTGTIIKPGQQLKVTASNTNLNPTKGYVVTPGDTLYQIALNHNTTIQALVAANNLAGTTIHPSQVLMVPSKPAVVSRSTNKHRIAYTDEDLDLLARLIAAEAKSQPKEAQVGVGAVVINRVLNPRFPNSIKDVIYQPRQFGPASTGIINKPASQSCITAAREALNGTDTTNGALFFFDSGTTNSYLRSLPTSVKYGNMIFSHAK
jgi:LysM repeat protein